MSYFPHFDPYVIRERNEGLRREVQTLRLEERLGEHCESRGSRFIALARRGVLSLLLGTPHRVTTAAATRSCCNGLGNVQGSLAPHDEGDSVLRRRLTAMLATMVITALLAVGIASADPLNSPNAGTLDFVCGGEEVTFVTLPNRAPALNVVEGTSTFHITELTFTATDQDTGDIVFTDTLTTGQGNQTGLQEKLVTCTAPSNTFVDEETGHTIVVDATAVGFFTPVAG
jgi:hypothetical protein